MWCAVFHSAPQVSWSFLKNNRPTTCHWDPTGLWTLSRAATGASDQRTCEESVWMRACVCARLPSAHTLPLLLFCSRQTVALVTQRAPVGWKWEKMQLYLFILSNFFPSFLSEGWEYAPRIFSHQEEETEMTSDVTRLEHYWFFLSLCILLIQELSLLFKTCTSFPPKQHHGRLYENTNNRTRKPKIYIEQHHLLSRH